MMKEMPQTDHDLLVRIWAVLEGTNGSGLIAKVDSVVEEVASIKLAMPGLWTREDHNSFLKEERGTKERRKLTIRDWVLIIGTILSPLIAVLISRLVHI
jgi:hypothetical protein